MYKSTSKKSSSKKSSSTRKDDIKLYHSPRGCFDVSYSSECQVFIEVFWPFREVCSYATPGTASCGTVILRKCFSLFSCEFLLWHSNPNIMQYCCNVVSVTWACSDLDKFVPLRYVAVVTLKCAWTYWTSLKS